MARQVGQFAIASAMLMGAGRVIAVDKHDDRLAIARRQGAEIINFEQEDSVQTIVALTGGIGVDRVIDAVGVESEHAHSGLAAEQAGKQEAEFQRELDQTAPQHRDKGPFAPGDAPSQALRWGVEALAKAGTMAIIGVYPPTVESFPIGQAMNKNLTVKMGNCNHRKYIPQLVDLVRSGVIDPVGLITKAAELTDAIDAYTHFDAREPGWLKVELEPVQ